MPILYTPEEGMPWEVPFSELSGFIARGFRSKPPQSLMPQASPIIEDPKVVDSTGAVVGDPITVPTVADPNRTNINTASLAQLAKLPQIGTAFARKIKEAREQQRFEDVEDLIARIKDVAWLSLADKISF